MEPKLFIGFTKESLDTTYSYIIKENIFHHLKKRKIPFTTNIDDDFTEALFTSATELSYFYPQVLKKNAKITIVGLSSPDDFFVDPNNDNKLILSQNANNYYLRADRILVNYTSQAMLLASQGIVKTVNIIKPALTFNPEEPVSNTVKNAFRSFYQIPDDKKVVISLSSYQKQEELDLFNGIARINPEYIFLFFGEAGKNNVKVKLLQRLAKNENTQYLETIPEELYHSALLAADAYFIPRRYLYYPLTALDFMAHKVPIIAYKSNNFKDLINEDTALVPNSFAELYHCFRSLFIINKAKEAYEFVKRIAFFD